ncbi:hypothetical protein JOF53_002206 [Crossiella equi]|uniref:LPXTG cell wall anchor domain-containing protein n=1 Tax=Crossiella equi TaxID=130796 RepID=A0ABS5AAW4_9PSEU|nr:hypothetical protein [Crossiella equi]MBP2473334.1 hypothetical protein [Crossiella equi]
MTKYLLALLVVLLGAAAVVYGGHDDSPGLQLIGLALVLGTIGTTAYRRSRSRG